MEVLKDILAILGVAVAMVLSVLLLPFIGLESAGVFDEPQGKDGTEEWL